MKSILISIGLASVLFLATAGSGAGVETENMAAVNISVGGSAFSAELYDNAAASALEGMMPFEFTMDDLHGNEKYFYLSNPLPTDTQSVGSIRAGDIMLYGTDCLVLFYEDFQTSFSYTRLGRLEDPSGLPAAAGRGSVRVSFEKAE